MNLQECYAALSGDLSEAMGRLRSERLVKKFVLRFLDDPSCALLKDAIAAKNGEEAFRAAHTMKGICANLSFTRLYNSSNELSEALRHGWRDDAVAIAQRVYDDYRITAEAIEAYKRDSEG